MNILSSQQFDPPVLEAIYKQADMYREHVSSSDGRRTLMGKYAGEILFNIFYEASTRTRVSFGTAALRLGMRLEGTENAKLFSSAAKGETLEDTIQVLNEYEPAVIVLRHDETGSAGRAAAVSRVPIINGGDGKGEHPTQAVLDLYTIQEKKHRLHDLKVVMGGDLKNGRTVRSLSQLLAHYPGNSISFVSTPDLQIGDDIKTYLSENDTPHCETSDMYETLRDADVVYWTRLQKERQTEEESRQMSGTQYMIDQTALEILPADSIIMHPLPRVGEISPEVDKDPRAVYFRQAGNGMYTRMALIDLALNNL
ncbi:MAG: aspartate carbamoyltransferase [Candidatus Saccharimonadales bacterium]